MKKKILKSVLNANLSASALATKTVSFSADAPAVELRLLPVLPASPFRTTDSRSEILYSYDQAGLIERFNKSGRKANLNIEHNRTSDTRSRGNTAELTCADREPTLGLEPGITYAWFDLSSLGASEMEQHLWLYGSAEVSGAWLDKTSMHLTKFNGHAFSNSPATEMPANFSAEDEDDTDDADTGTGNEAPGAPPEAGYTTELTTAEADMLKKLLEKLGLTADTPEAEALSRVDALLTPAPSAADTALTAMGFTALDVPALVAPATFAAVNTQLTAAQGEVVALTAQVGTLTASLSAATAAESTRMVFAAVDGAIAARKATPALRASLAKFAAADPVGFAEYVAEAPVVLAADNATIPSADAAQNFGLTAQELATAKAARISPETYATAREQARAQLGT